MAPSTPTSPEPPLVEATLVQPVEATPQMAELVEATPQMAELVEAPVEAPPLVGIVLAAGAGRRMGGPKALIGPLADGVRTPLARVCSWLHEAGVHRVIAVIGAEADAVRAALASDPLIETSLLAYLVEATDWAEGMGASLRAGLRAAALSGAAAALITLVDLPDVRTSVYRRVLERAGSAPQTLARASFSGRPGHPVVIGRDHWDAVARVAVGDRGARDVFATHEHALIECGDLASGEDADSG